MHQIIVSNIPPTGRLEIPPTGQRLEALPGETYELRLSGAGVESLEVTMGTVAINGRNVTFTEPGPVQVKVHPNDGGSPSQARFLVCEQAAVDWIPDHADQTPTRKRLALRSLSQAPWFDGTKASMMGRSLAEFGA